MVDIETYKIQTADFSGKDVASMPDNPSADGYTSAELKAGFDKAVKEVVTPKHNGIITTMKSTDGAGNIGATAVKTGGATTVQGILSELKTDTDTALAAKFDNADVNTSATLGSTTDKVPSEYTVSQAMASAGYGDMLKSVYDTGNNGKVDISENAEKLGGELPAYYAKQSKVEETSNGTITVIAGSVIYSGWQRRNGWVRIAVMVAGIGIAHNAAFGNIIGAYGLPNITNFIGACRLANGAYMPCVIDIDTTTGQMKARNNSASTMTDLAFDVTVPAKTV